MFEENDSIIDYPTILTNEIIEGLDISKVYALSISTEGAQGDPGKVTIVFYDDSHTIFYYGSYFYNKTFDIEKLIEKIPEVDANAELENINWNSWNMGCGNELLLINDLNIVFEKFYKNLTPLNIYRYWKYDMFRILPTFDRNTE